MTEVQLNTDVNRNGILSLGISTPRGQTITLTSRLPSPRAVSELLVPDDDRPSRDFTLLLMQWGQFIGMMCKRQ